MSALPPKADIAESDWHVRFVSKADMLESGLPSVMQGAGAGVGLRAGGKFAVEFGHH